MNGNGTMIWSNGNRYDGFWEDGFPKGDGNFRWADGSFYVGVWSKDGKEQNGTYYPSDSTLQLLAYSDADWGRCAYTCRSLSGYCVFLGSSLVSWKTKKQKTVSKSSAESEYRSMSYTTSEVVWLEGLLRDLGVCTMLPISLCCDNKSAQHLAANPVFH